MLGARAARGLTSAFVAYLLVVLAVTLALPRPLGHDEAVYATGGLWSDDPAHAYPVYRPIGMRVLTTPGVALGGDELAIRIGFTAIALGYLAAVHAIARRHAGTAAAVLATAVIATTSDWQWRAVEALSDIPSALALLGLAHGCAVGGLPGAARARRSALATAGCAALACYLRYASAPVVVVVLVVAALSDPRRVRWLAAVAALTGLLLVPLLAWSVHATGAPLGVLVAGDRMANRRFYGEGLLFYLRAWPVLLAGPITGAVAALGLAVGLAGWRRWPAPAPRTHARRVLATVALAQLGLLGWRAHGETRFVYLALTALVIVAAGWLAERPRAWRAAIIAAAATAIPSAIWTVLRVAHLAERRAAHQDASGVIRADAAGAPCQVFATEGPMTTWYTGCATVTVDGWGLDPADARGERVYLLEARGLPRSLGDAEARTRAALGWARLSCAEPARMCVWRARR